MYWWVGLRGWFPESFALILPINSRKSMFYSSEGTGLEDNTGTGGGDALDGSNSLSLSSLLRALCRSKTGVGRSKGGGVDVVGNKDGLHVGRHVAPVVALEKVVPVESLLSLEGECRERLGRRSGEPVSLLGTAADDQVLWAERVCQ